MNNIQHTYYILNDNINILEGIGWTKLFNSSQQKLNFNKYLSKTIYKNSLEEGHTHPSWLDYMICCDC